jgi:membrane protein insertase Oxa1/YidC/SpoIIIJ
MVDVYHCQHNRNPGGAPSSRCHLGTFVGSSPRNFISHLNALSYLLSQMQNGARMAHMKPELEALTAKIKENSDVSTEEREKQSRQMKNLFEKYRCHPVRSLMMPLMQMPIFISMFFGLKTMSEHFPSLNEGGILWFQDLTQADATYGLPIITAFSFLMIIEVGADGQDTRYHTHTLCSYTLLIHSAHTLYLNPLLYVYPLLKSVLLV